MLNIKLCNIVSDGPYSIGYKSGNNPYPETSGFNSVGTGLTATTITITGLSFNTQYWVKMVDDESDRYIIRNISTNHSKTYPCYDTLCFDVDAECLNPLPVTPTPTITPTNTPTLTPTPTISYKTWTIQECSSGPCVTGQCGCSNQISTTVYTSPDVTDITDPGTIICINQSLTLAFVGYFSQGGEIYDVNAGTPTQYCTIGVDPC